MLTPDHALALRLRGTESRQAQTLALRASLGQPEGHALTARLEGGGSGFERARRLALSGRWQADRANRLTFLVEKADGTEDRLTLDGGWEVGPHHELRYRYRERPRGTRSRAERILTFQGAWDVAGPNRLVYRLAGSGGGAFEFQASLRTRTLIARDGRLVYEAGIRLSRGRLLRRRIALFGTWKLHRDRSVSFEVPYADGRVQGIVLEGEARLGAGHRVELALRSRRHEPLGMTLTLTRELSERAALFLRLRGDAQERSAIAGVRVRF